MKYAAEPLHKDIKNKAYVAWLEFLHTCESWTKEQIAAYQLEQLQRIVRLAYETPGYKKLFGSLNPDDLQTLEDVRKFPLIEKEVLRDALDDFSVTKVGAEYITTGGSTGIPFGFYRKPEAFAKELASKAHQYRRLGWVEGVRQLVLRGIPIDNEEKIVFFPEFNELRCSSYHLTPTQMDTFVKAAHEYKPSYLKCYPSAGYILARYLKESGKSFPPLRAVLCASENLYEHQKELMKEVFKTRVYSHYGHYELAAIAGFCETEDTYHVLPQYGFVELLDKNGNPVTQKGKVGEIVATSFLMDATVFFRYRTKDLAVFEGFGCSACGRQYQIWSKIEGRLQEFIITEKGRYISMVAMNMHDTIFDDLQQFQFHQKEKGKVTFTYIVRENAQPDLEKIRAGLMVKLGDDVSLTLQEVETIPLTKRGKHRFLLQELPLEFGDI